MVEVVVRPVGGEHDRVLAVEELHQRDDVAQVLGLLDRLRGDVDLLEVVARALGEERDLAPALEVLLVEALAEEGHPRDPGLGHADPQAREAHGHAGGEHVDEVRHDRERVARGMAAELGVEAVVVEREHRRGDGDGVQEQWQLRGLGGGEDRVVAAVAPERVEARARQVDARHRRLGGVALDLRGGRRRVLRAGHDRAEQLRPRARPLGDEPRVVGARERRGVVGLGEDGELEQVIGEQDREVDLDLLEL